jgi:hypothetical protein
MDMGSGGSLLESLRSLDVVDSEVSSFELVPEGGWMAGGAETYLFRFFVRTSSSEVRLLLKAVTAFGGGGVGEIADEWVRRRLVLRGMGVSVPTLYAVQRATLLEEYIPYSLPEAIALSGENETAVRAECVEMAAAVGRAGFRPVSLFYDARSRGSDVVMVDFGSDLGARGEDSRRSAALGCLVQFAQSVGWSLTDQETAYVTDEIEE